ncbi:hypothetical protein MHYP_G00353640 [Metynnis hypsauchen]
MLLFYDSTASQLLPVLLDAGVLALCLMLLTRKSYSPSASGRFSFFSAEEKKGKVRFPRFKRLFRAGGSSRLSLRAGSCSAGFWVFLKGDLKPNRTSFLLGLQVFVLAKKREKREVASRRSLEAQRNHFKTILGPKSRAEPLWRWKCPPGCFLFGPSSGRSGLPDRKVGGAGGEKKTFIASSISKSSGKDLKVELNSGWRSEASAGSVRGFGLGSVAVPTAALRFASLAGELCSASPTRGSRTGETPESCVELHYLRWSTFAYIT